MAKTMLVHCKPFDRINTLYILDNETKETKEIKVLSDLLIKTILDTSNNLDCHTLNIKGSKIYTKGIEKKIINAEIAQYDKQVLTINLVK